MQNLILDFGNTLFKAAVFEQGNLVHKFSGSQLFPKELKELQKQFPYLKKAIYSSVIELNTELTAFLNTNFDCLELTSETKIPIVNRYKTPKTLGKDRLAAVVGAFNLFPNQDLLIIDSGSSITYDLLTHKSNYLGGGISPGISMRFKALNQFTGKLPLVKPLNFNTNLIGTDTEESILSGVINGVKAEIDGIIDQYKKLYPEILVIFTGGDLKHFDKNLKNNIFAAENLVLHGLNFILNYNDNKTV